MPKSPMPSRAPWLLRLLAAALLCARLPLSAQTTIVPPGPAPDPGLSLGEQAPANLDPDVAATLVVYNQNDQESELLAQFYAEKRGIPREHILGLQTSTKEEITRAEYDDTIADPLRKAFTANFWWKLQEPGSPHGPVASNQIRFIALIRGIPLKIAPVDKYPGDKPYDTTPIGKHNEASVDSELSLLGYRLRTISGAVNNPYYHSYASIREARRDDLMLVCRLDGPSASIVRRMIVDSLATEQSGLRGFAYIDARGIGPNEPGLIEGDQWLHAAAQDIRRQGLPVILDDGPAMFPEGYPMRYAALYLGWYSERVAGPFARPGFRFVPGAIAIHIHSFSGATVRNPGANWVAPLLELGAAATVGNVYEPYLSLTPHLDILEERLRLGFTFAEAAYSSQRVLSWMTTFVGDPLYRPFPAVPTTSAGKAGAEWDAYKQGADRWLQDPKAGALALQQSAKKLKSGIIWEGLALLQIGLNDHAGALASLEQARKTYTNPEDIMRATIHTLIQLRAAGKDAEGVALARRQAATYPTSPSLSVLQMLAPTAFSR